MKLLADCTHLRPPRVSPLPPPPGLGRFSGNRSLGLPAASRPSSPGAASRRPRGSASARAAGRWARRPRRRPPRGWGSGEGRKEGGEGMGGEVGGEGGSAEGGLVENLHGWLRARGWGWDAQHGNRQLDRSNGSPWRGWVGVAG